MKHLKNYDAPQNIENRQKINLRKQHDYDLGLEIFALKKELRLNLKDDRQKDSITNSQERPVITSRSHFNQRKSHSASPDNHIHYEKPKYQRGGSSSKRKSKGSKYQKLVKEQQREWKKKLHREKISQIMHQKKIICNLQQLNQIAAQKRQGISHNKESKIKQGENQILKGEKKMYQFKTTTDQRNNHDISTLQADSKQIEGVKKQKKESQTINNDNQQIVFSSNDNFNKESIAPKKHVDSIKQIDSKKQKQIFPYAQKNNKTSLDKENQSVIINQEEQNKIILKKNVKQSKRKSKSKGRIIQKLLKQIEMQQQQIQLLKQNLSEKKVKERRRSKQKSASPKIRQNENQLQNDYPQNIEIKPQHHQSTNNLIDHQDKIQSGEESIFQEEPAIKPQTLQKELKEFIKQQNNAHGMILVQPKKIISTPKNDNNIPLQIKSDKKSTINEDKVVIDDDMMIFCVLSTAASVIQKRYREYASRKKNILQPSEEEKDHLSESARLEDRFYPLLKDMKPHNKRSPVVQGNQKSVKHTFSFGESIKSLPQSLPQASTEKQEEIKIDTIQVRKEQQDQIAQSSEESKQSQLPPLVDSMESSIKVDAFIKLDDKFRFALRSLAEKQKQNIVDQMKAKKRFENIQEEKVKQDFQRKDIYFIGDSVIEESNSFLQSIDNQAPDYIIEVSAREKEPDLIDLSKITIDIPDDNDLDINRPDDVQVQNELDSILIKEQDVSNLSSMKEESKKQEPNKVSSEDKEILNELENNISQDFTLVNEQSIIAGPSIDVSHIQQNPAANESNEDFRDSKEQYINEDEGPSIEEEFKISQNDIKFIDIPRIFHNQKEIIDRHQFSSVQPGSPHNNIELPAAYQSNQGINKSVLRMMYGDEKFLQDHDYAFLQPSLQHSPRSLSHKFGSGLITDPSHPLGAYFLSTNTSIFDRNPFQEFSTNKLHELLQGKNYQEVVAMREEALKFQARLEKGFINRIEQKEEASPHSVQRRKYELEKWVSAQSEKPNVQPRNPYDIEQERKEAAEIIASVNKKAREIKEKLQRAQSSSTSKQQPGSSSSKIGLAIEEAKSSEVSDFINKQLLQSEKEIIISPPVEQIAEQQADNNKVEVSMVELTFDEDHTSQNRAITLNLEDIDSPFRRSENKDIPLILAMDTSIDEEAQHNANDKEEEMREKAEQLSEKIFQDIILQELAQLKFQREPIQNIPMFLKAPQIEEEVKVIEVPQVEEVKETVTKSEFSVEWLKEQEQQPKQNEQEQVLSLGIDTSEQAIDQYIEEIFEQIRPRKEQFLQAFITPIYKNPMDVLALLQKPEFANAGYMDEINALSLLDATNSLAYILNVQLYLTLEKAKENIIHETIEQIRRQHMAMVGQSSKVDLSSLPIFDEEMTDLMSEAQHIHNKVVFDCVNESLNMVRPYGSHGEPMPWSKKPRKNLIFLFDSVDDLDQILLQVKNRVINWSRIKAGVLPQNNDKHSGKNEEDALLAHQRERCLANLLAQDLVKDEEKWLDYEMEETLVKIDLSDIVLEQLVGETVNILNKLQNRSFK